MNDDFVAEIRRATDTLRAGDMSGSTAIIQAALAAGGLTRSGNEPKGRPGGFRMPEQAGVNTIEGTLAADGPDQASDGVNSRDTARGQRRRQPLGDVLRTLRAGRKKLGLDGKLPGSGQQARTPDLPLPAGAAFHDRHYACAAGGRRYRLYVPACAEGGLEGLIVMLHGCTQNPEDFAAGTGMNDLAEEHRLLVVYPAQTSGDNAMACWNWFRPGDQRRDAGEPAIIAGLTKSLRDDFCIRHDRVYLAGLSAGGAMAAIMGETYPELYAGIGVHSGLAHGSANDVVSAMAAMRGEAATQTRRSTTKAVAPRLIVFHGSADSTVHPANADRIIASQDGAHGRTSSSAQPGLGGRRGYSKVVTEREDGTRALECWIIEGAPHAWSGGSAAGTYTDPQGPDASAAMVDFFLNGSGRRLSDLPGALA